MKRKKGKTMTENTTPQITGEIVKIVDLDGQEKDIEVREATVGQRIEITERCANAETGKFSLLRFYVEATLQCCYVPGTNVRHFTEKDREAINNLPVSRDFTEKIGTVAARLMNAHATGEGVEKN